MDEDILLNIYDDTSKLRSGKTTLLDDLLPCGERYKDLEKLTSGGMKNVFKCYDSHIDSQVVLVTPKEEDFYESFIREGRITSFLQHPNIMSVSDMGLMNNEAPFFTMKYCSGEDFDKHLKKDFKLPEKLSHFIKICDAVNYAHSRGVIHLDLKPSNIRIGLYGEVLVGDWGIAELNYEIDDADESYLDKDLQKILLYRKPTNLKTLSGTPGYIAPERYSICKPQAANDIYSLGAMLYEILTGTSPEKSGLIFTEEQPEGLVAICRKALEKSVDDRYGNMQELVDDLNRYTQGFATKAENAGLLRLLKLVYQRNQSFCHLLATSLILLVLIISVAFKRISESRKIALNEKEAAYNAKQKTEKLFSELQLEQQRSIKLMHQSAENHLVIARQKLVYHLYQESEAAFKLARQLNPESKKVREFEAKLKLIYSDWQASENLFRELKNDYAVQLIQKLKGLSSEATVDHLGEVKKLLGRHFMIYFLDKRLQVVKNDDFKYKLYLWSLRERHVGMRFFPEVTFVKEKSGLSVTFKKSLAVKSIEPIRYLNPVKINLAHSGLIYETGLNSCENLRELNISGTGMLGAGALKIKSLRKINVSHTSFNDARQFNGLPALEEIDVSFTRIKYFEGFKVLRLLKKLIIDESQLQNARKNFPNLEISVKK